MERINSQIMALPRGILKQRYGVSMDIGGTVIKTAFVLPTGGSKDDVHVMRFTRDEMTEALLCLKQNCTFLKPGQTIYTTGNATSIYKKQIEETLQVTVVNVIELSCFVTAMKRLRHAIPESELIFPPSESARKSKERYRQQFARMRQQREAINVPEAMAKENVKCSIVVKQDSGQNMYDPYPYLVAMLGSGCGILQVTEAGYSMFDYTARCGKTLLSLGSLLMGEKTFEGLMSMAGRGDNDNIDITGAFIKKGAEKDDPYQTLPDDAVLFSLSQAMGKDLNDFRKEDLAKSLLTTICIDLVQAMELNYYLSGAKSLYVVGGFCDESEICRTELEKHMAVRNVASEMDKGLEPVELKIVRNGGYLGALGALIFGMEK